VPIRESERKRYPPRAEWRKIRAAILERTEHKCETCGAPNGALIIRDIDDPFVYETHAACGGCAGGDPDCLRAVRIVLTIAHLDHTPENNDPNNLRALCQRCHLRYDAMHHAANARETRRSRKAIGDLF
jgi:5-methylcytosine-specific restriction endonuclease McrA